MDPRRWWRDTSLTCLFHKTWDCLTLLSHSKDSYVLEVSLCAFLSPLLSPPSIPHTSFTRFTPGNSERETCSNWRWRGRLCSLSALCSCRPNCWTEREGPSERRSGQETEREGATPDARWMQRKEGFSHSSAFTSLDSNSSAVFAVTSWSIGRRA